MTRKMLVAMCVFAGCALAGEYIVLVPAGAPQPPESAGARPINTADKNEQSNPDYVVYDAKLRPFFPNLSRSPLQFFPAGTVFDVEDGSMGDSISSIEAARTNQRVAAARFREFLGTNSYVGMRRALRADITTMTTGTPSAAQSRTAWRAVLQLNRLEQLREAKEWERVKARVLPEAQDVE